MSETRAAIPPLFALISTPPLDVDDLCAVEWVEAVETHPLPGQTPAEFNRDGSQRGVIVFGMRR